MKVYLASKNILFKRKNPSNHWSYRIVIGIHIKGLKSIGRIQNAYIMDSNTHKYRKASLYMNSPLSNF